MKLYCPNCTNIFWAVVLTPCNCPNCGFELMPDYEPTVDNIRIEFYKFRFCYNTFAMLKKLPRIGFYDNSKIENSMQFHMSARRKISEYLQPQQLYIENHVELLDEKYRYQYEAIKHVIETEEVFEEMAKTYNVRITSPFILTSSQVKTKLGPGYRIVEVTTESDAPPKPIVDVDSAVIEIINAGYRALARANHPDLVGDADNPDIAERDRRTQVMVTLNRAKKELVALLEMVKG